MKKLIVIISFFITFIFSGCSNQTITPEVYSGFYFDTYIQITIYDNTDDKLFDKISSELSFYDSIFSESLSDNTLALINSSDYQNDLVPEEDFIYLLNLELKYAGLTDGAFDPTIYSVSKLWDFKSSQPVPPSVDSINNALSYVDYRNIYISGDYVIKTSPDTKISFGAVAKGYIADKIAELLLNEGINNAIINLGGNVLCIGQKPDKTDYTIGIAKPFSSTENILILNIKDHCSVVTSGVYERYFYDDDILYHHIIDTSTGYPVQNGLYSVTVVGPESTVCDFLSTALFTLYNDNQKAQELLNEFPGYYAVYITNQYEIIYSENFPTEIIRN